MPRYPKPDGEKRNANPPAFGWTELPAQREGEIPALPEWKVWHPATVQWWSELWTTPQSSQWDATGRTLVPLAMIYDDLISGRADIAKVSAELRQHEDRHGLNPKAMLQLRWRVPRGVSVDPALIPSSAADPASDSRRKRLQVVG